MQRVLPINHNGLTCLFPGVSSYSLPKTQSSPDPKLQTLWILGDSQAERLFISITNGPLCKEIFRTCNLTKMWTYAWPSVQPVAWDNKDFNPQQVIDLVRKVLEKPEMNENSAMVLNLGLHYIESTSLANYRHLLNGVRDLLNEGNAETGDLKHKAHIIWRRGMCLFLTWCHRLICIILCLLKYACKEVCDVKPRIDPCPYLLGRGPDDGQIS